MDESPVGVLENGGESFGYKNRNVREETLYLLQKAIYSKR